MVVATTLAAWAIGGPVLEGDDLIHSAEPSIAQTGSVLPQVQKLVFDLEASVPFATLAVPPSPSVASLAGRRALVTDDVAPPAGIEPASSA